MSSQFHIYGVEISNQRHDGAYIQFYRKSTVDTNDSITYGPKISNNQWIWSQFYGCNDKYDPDAKKCSLLAPFDNPMQVWLRLLIGDTWCDDGVNESDYDAFDHGVEMEIADVVVYALQFDECHSDSI